MVKRDCLNSGEIFFAAVGLFSEGRVRGGEEGTSACGGGWSRRGWEDTKKPRIDDGPDQVPELNGANTDR